MFKWSFCVFLILLHLYLCSMYQILLWRNIPKASIVELETEEIAEQATGQSKQRARKGPE